MTPQWQKVWKRKPKAALVVGPLRYMLRQPPGDVVRIEVDEKTGRKTAHFLQPCPTMAHVLAQSMLERALTSKGMGGQRAMERIVRITDGAWLDAERELAIKAVEHATTGEQAGTITIVRGPAHQLQAHDENGNGNGNGAHKDEQEE